jgi:hypothetical protein
MCNLHFARLKFFRILNMRIQASPRLRFNREGSLLAVTTNDNGIKILVNADGQRLLRMLESRAFEGSRGPPPQQINTKVGK